MRPETLPGPTESQMQQAVFAWALLMSKRWPELELLAHVPNGGARSKATAGRLKAEGVRAGWPDIILPVGRKPYLSLMIELKRIEQIGRKHGGLSESQIELLPKLAAQGNAVVVCHTVEDATDTIRDYLMGVLTRFSWGGVPIASARRGG